ncbi:uncharacterized protein TRAVEDRAFT_163609 [Trametes versicolor FP-101664 SS1]|uniref:uncharacterized protein n=1 Tax=Trametes versicolor (strain FP-101664) TaxID=717944 RepID=UPI0004621C34|nr:uncharacterized protein TRAVEDRAFT_163609 [Trametes versicolor FP-101664 SS1]EIW61950.1 hypothetical protein TRAVEDRAFT_163609 [Trametes versicolor FP-101664 SS1]
MDPDSAPSSLAPAARPDHDAVAAAIERRMQAERDRAAAAAQPSTFDGKHEKRQEFRRMIDPGILRPNPRPLALESLQTLLKLAQNIVDHPDEVKYQRFKPTNATIKRVLVDPRGTLEYAVALGFHPEVENFQPFYIFKKRHMEDLQIGAAMIKEALDRELVKEGRDQRRRAEEKAAHEAAVAKVKQAFYDDRKGRAITDERERIARAAAANRPAGSPAPAVRDHRPKRRMPGSGHMLSGEVVDLDGDDGEEEEGEEEAEEGAPARAPRVAHDHDEDDD